MEAAAAARDANPDVTRLLEDLADDSYRVREAATLALWEMGSRVTDEIRGATASDDPEVAMRARGLLRNIELHIWPDTPPEVVALVEAYVVSPTRVRLRLMNELAELRAWRQMLGLFAAEEDEATRESLARMVAGVAGEAARERVLAGDEEGALDFLAMAPADAGTLLALATYHRARGSWEEEWREAQESEAPGAPAWRLALLRAAGDAAGARRAAADLGDTTLEAAMAILAGDAAPFMSLPRPARRADRTNSFYEALAQRRWEGGSIGEEELAPTLRALGDRSPTGRAQALLTLILIGEGARALDGLAEEDRLAAHSLFEYLGMPDRAVEALGLDPEDPDFGSWVELRMVELAEAEDASEPAYRELHLLASLLDRRGEQVLLGEWFGEPLLSLAEENPEMFRAFVSDLLTDGFRPGSAPRLAWKVGSSWAGEHLVRWEELLDFGFGEDPVMFRWWNWMDELLPDTPRPERLEILLALRGLIPDPRHLGTEILDRAWREWDELAEGDPRRSEILGMIDRAADLSFRVETSLRVWDLKDEDERAEVNDLWLVRNLGAGGRWDELADRLAQRMEGEATSPIQATRQRAQLAAVQRRAGRDREAAALEREVDLLYLGNADLAAVIAFGYAAVADFEGAARWWRRAAFESAPDARNHADHLERHAEQLLEERDFAPAAAVYEVLLWSMSRPPNAPEFADYQRFLGWRTKADLAWSLSRLEESPSLAIERLGRTHGLLLGDASLADHFFPAVREAGLVEEHDRWFERSWERMAGLVERFPEADNLRNSAGWVASRAARRLGEAETMLHEALTMNPGHPAYLDTLAEIRFALGDRGDAVDLGRQAVMRGPHDTMILRQFRRFEEGPFPE